MVLSIEPGIFMLGWAGAPVEQDTIVVEAGPSEAVPRSATQLW